MNGWEPVRHEISSIDLHQNMILLYSSFWTVWTEFSFHNWFKAVFVKIITGSNKLKFDQCNIWRLIFAKNHKSSSSYSVTMRNRLQLITDKLVQVDLFTTKSLYYPNSTFVRFLNNKNCNIKSHNQLSNQQFRIQLDVTLDLVMNCYNFVIVTSSKPVQNFLDWNEML